MLASHNESWHWIYGALGSVRCRVRGIRTERDLPRFTENVDYFRSEEALLQFIHSQVTILALALFTPTFSYLQLCMHSDHSFISAMTLTHITITNPN